MTHATDDAPRDAAFVQERMEAVRRRMQAIIDDAIERGHHARARHRVAEAMERAAGQVTP